MYNHEGKEPMNGKSLPNEPFDFQEGRSRFDNAPQRPGGRKIRRSGRLLWFREVLGVCHRKGRPKRRVMKFEPRGDARCRFPTWRLLQQNTANTFRATGSPVFRAGHGPVKFWPR